MEFTTQNPLTSEEVRAFLQSKWPSNKTNVPPLNKRMTVIQNGMVMAKVSIRDGNQVRVRGDLNTLNPLVLIGIVVGVFFGLIGAAIILGVLYAVKSKDMQLWRDEVGQAVKTQFAGAQ